MASQSAVEPPAKRRRLSTDFSSTKNDDNMLVSDAAPVQAGLPVLTEAQKQSEVGIQEFVNPTSSPFYATLKTRYTDFLVNEILPNGQVIHLRDTKAPKQKPRKTQLAPKGESNTTPDQDNAHQVSIQATKDRHEDAPAPKGGLPDVTESDQAKLTSFFNETAVTELLDLYKAIQIDPGKKSGQYPLVRADFTSDRSVRSQIHQSIRDIFRSSIDSSTDHDGTLILTAAKMVNSNRQDSRSNGPQFKNQRPGKLGWADRGGEYLHFTLTKENKDTMEVVSYLTRQLKCNAKIFQFAGTKDRRAVTSQRCSAYRIEAERLGAQNRTLRGSKVGDFEYHSNGLELGDLSGNEFVITLRNVQMEGFTVGDILPLRTEIHQRLQSLRDHGFLNYYGLQRFGTFSIRTDIIGRDILREDFAGACNAILAFNQAATDPSVPDSNSKVSQDDRNRALAIQSWRQDGRANAALDTLPRKFSAEAQIIRHLSKHPNDHFGALMNIQRNLRLMYVHAYQSLVWNLAASHRLKLHGNKVVKGDLVLVQEHKGKELDVVVDQNMTIDADGEEIIVPATHDRAAQEDEVFERARALTEDEANSGQYTMFDIVLPQPGFDVTYPDNECGVFYKTFMSSLEGGELDPYNMRRKQRDFSLSGAYRKLLARIGENFDVTVHKYERDEEQFVQTDLDLLSKNGPHENGGLRERQGTDGAAELEAPAKEESGDKIAVVLKFQLGSSQYATMVLRELSKDGIGQHKPDFGGGR